MKKIFFLVLTASLLFGAGCRISELTPAEKEKISLLQADIIKIEKDISDASNGLDHNNTGLIPTLRRSRIETDKLTVSILRQHIAVIESGAKVTVSATSASPDMGTVAKLDAEIKETSSALNKTRAESNLYSGGVIKAMLDARASTEALTLSLLNQKMLAAKYGLTLPNVGNQNESKDATNAKGAQNINSEKKQTDQPKPIKVEDPGPFDFRHARWGMSMEDVKKRESASLVGEDEESLLYAGLLDGQKVVITYAFVDDKLWRGVYSLDENFSNDNRYVDIYSKFIDMLKEKYGKPKREIDHWSKEYYRGKYEKRGMAYAVGDVVSQVTWENGDTSIFAKIDGNNFKISVRIFYSSNALELVFREKEKSKKQENF